jgi:hypothetical protein
MKKMDLLFRTGVRERKETDEEEYPGYQPYPPDEDIYTKNKQETTIDPEDIAPDRTYPKTGVNPDAESEPDVAEVDLDIPGAELDDELESIGSEDEENNYYSITDDNFDDLEDILDR